MSVAKFVFEETHVDHFQGGNTGHLHQSVRCQEHLFSLTKQDDFRQDSREEINM